MKSLKYTSFIKTFIESSPAQSPTKSEGRNESDNKATCEKTGKSEYWLRTHECPWCGQTALNAVRYGCGSIFEKCNPMDKFR